MTDETDDTPPMADYMASVRRYGKRMGIRLKQEFMSICPHGGQCIHPDEMAFLAEDTDEQAEEDANMVLAFTPPEKWKQMAADYEAARARMQAMATHMTMQGGTA